jgi:hypothetical protein
MNTLIGPTKAKNIFIFCNGPVIHTPKRKVQIALDDYMDTQY